jgi:signal peptidase II
MTSGADPSTLMPASDTVEPASGVKRWFVVAGVLVVALDQLTKFWVGRALRGSDDLDVVGGLLKLSYTENPGIAFGMLGNNDVKWPLVAVSVAAISIVAFYLIRTPASNKLMLWSLTLLGAGITGNLIDRVRLGRVVDFIDVYYQSFHWPVFNVADSAITIGAGLMAIELFLGHRRSPAPEATVSEDAQR